MVKKALTKKKRSTKTYELDIGTAVTKAETVGSKVRHEIETYTRPKRQAFPYVHYDHFKPLLHGTATLTRANEDGGDDDEAPKPKKKAGRSLAYGPLQNEAEGRAVETCGNARGRGSVSRAEGSSLATTRLTLVLNDTKAQPQGVRGFVIVS